VKDALAVTGFDPWNGWQVIDHARGEQEFACRRLCPVTECDLEMGGTTDCIDDGHRSHFHALILTQLFTSQPQEFGGCHPIACEKPVEGLRGCIAVLPGITDQHAPSASPKDERGAEPRRPGIHNDHIKQEQVLVVESTLHRFLLLSSLVVSPPRLLKRLRL